MTPLSARVQSLAPSIIREMNGRRRPTSIDLSLGQPALPPDEGVIQRAMENTAKTGWGYTPNAGLPEVREAIARHHSLHERDAAENVIVTVGSLEAIYLALMASVDPGDEVLVPEPGFPAYIGICRLLGAVAVPFALDRSRQMMADPDELASRITPKTRVMILNAPSNPFGGFEDRETLQRIAALADQHEFTIVSDEIYRDLIYGDRRFESVTSFTKRTILVGGLSKNCAMTGFRLGYLIADRAFVAKTTLAHQLLVTCAPRISQFAALEIFRRPELLSAHLPFYREARDAVLAAGEALPEDTPLHVGDGAFYAVVDVSSRVGDDPLAFAIELLETQDVVVVPGTAFGPSGAWFWRLSYAAGAEASSEGVRRIAQFLA